MNIETSEIEYCKLNVKCIATTEEVESKRAEIFEHFKKETVPGFRPGKATPDAVKHHFRQRINEWLKSDMMQLSIDNTVSEKNIKPFGQAQIIVNYLDGSNFNCEFCIHKLPEITLCTYKDLELPKGHIPNSTEMSEKILQELRTNKNYVSTVPFGDDDFIQDGDTAIINYAAYVIGELEPAIKIDGHMLVVGKSDLEVVDENLLGMRLGEIREFTTIVPINSTSQALAGKETKFVIELTMASKTDPAPLDDELAHKMGLKDLAELTGMAQGMASARVQDLEKKYLLEQISARLVEGHDFVVPSWLSSFEAEMLARQYGHKWITLTDEQKKTFVDVSEKNVKLSIVLDAIRENEPDAQMTQEEIMSAVSTSVSKYKEGLVGMQNKSNGEVLESISKSGFMPALIGSVKDDYTMQFIINNSRIVE